MTEVHIKRTKAYILHTSAGKPIKLDEEELPKVIQAVQSNQPVVLKQGVLLNPRHGVTITPDRDRIEEYFRDVNRGDTRREAQGMKPLKAYIDREKLVNSLQLQNNDPQVRARLNASSEPYLHD